MKENYEDESKLTWRRLFKKKWFFPTLYLSIAALLLVAVIWYQAVENRMSDSADPDQLTSDFTGDLFDEEAEAVLQQNEVIKMPIDESTEAEIVTTFYDYDGEKESQESGLILYNNRYYQSTGVDIATSSGDTFDVIASLSGTVEDVKEDPLLGNVVIMSHDNDVKTYYASLEEISTKAGDQVKQGDKIGTAGKSLFNQESGTHVHFEIRKNDIEVNPESFFNKSARSLVEVDVEEREVEEPTEAEANDEGEDDVDKEEEKENTEENS